MCLSWSKREIRFVVGGVRSRGRGRGRGPGRAPFAEDLVIVFVKGRCHRVNAAVRQALGIKINKTASAPSWRNCTVQKQRTWVCGKKRRGKRKALIDLSVEERSIKLKSAGRERPGLRQSSPGESLVKLVMRWCWARFSTMTAFGGSFQ